MFDLNPQLRAVSNGRLAEVVQEGARLFAVESGSAPGAFGPRMVATTAAAIISELCHHPEHADIDGAMAFLRAGAATLFPAAPEPEAVPGATADRTPGGDAG